MKSDDENQVVIIGSINMDLVTRTSRLPLPGETVSGEELLLIPGGKGANQAAAIAKLNKQVAIVGRVGFDEFGTQLIENLHHLGVNTTPIIRDETTRTGVAVIAVDARGENTIILSPGANGKVCTEDVDAVEALIANSKILLLQLEIPIPAAEYAIALAYKYPVTIILNPAPAQTLSPDILKKLDILIPNETETYHLTGIKVCDMESAERAAEAIIEMGAPVVVITMGAKGVLLATKEKCAHIPSIPVDVVDTTAAGDAFIGGFVAGLLSGMELELAVRYACCAGALATTKLGAQSSLPTMDEVDDLFTKTGTQFVK